MGGSVAKWLACWTQAQKGPGSNRRVTAGTAESNDSLPPGLWLTSPAGWLPRTGISSGTLRSVIEYGLSLPFFNLYSCFWWYVNSCVLICRPNLVENLLVLREVIDVVLSGVVCAADSDDRHTGSQPRLSEAQQERTLYYTSYEERHENRYHVAGLHRYLYNVITYHIKSNQILFAQNTHTHAHTHTHTHTHTPI